MSVDQAAGVAPAVNGNGTNLSNKLKDVAELLNVRADGWYSETPEGVLSSFNGEDDPDGPTTLLEALKEAT